jgi:hypothetical protein
MITLRLGLAAFLLAVASLDIADGARHFTLAVTGLAVGLALLATVAVDAAVAAGGHAQTAP